MLFSHMNYLDFYFFPLSPRLEAVSAPPTAPVLVRSNSLWEVKRSRVAGSPAERGAEKAAPVGEAAFQPTDLFPLEWRWPEF